MQIFVLSFVVILFCNLFVGILLIRVIYQPMDILKEISSGIQYYLIFHTAIICVLKKMGKCIYEYCHVYKISLEGITKIFSLLLLLEKGTKWLGSGQNFHCILFLYCLNFMQLVLKNHIKINLIKNLHL